ncbi:MAG TPA: hypothetical protein VHO71_04835 [Caproiciproducens sp.]|nr:hypothetical protein [Caproiciproducens sp.]
MPDYGPDHECYGCPFVCKVMTWDPSTQTTAVQNHECRGSKTIRYDTTAGINTTDKTVADILTLDFKFLRQVREFAASLDGFASEHGYNGDFYNSSSCYSPDGRFRYPFYPEQNQKGIAAKAALKEHFFNPNGSRKDVTPEQEKDIVLKQIEKAKEEAQSMNSYYAPCGHKFSRSAGGAPEVTIEVTGTTQDCFTCPHALHEPATDEHGPKISCVCSRKKVEPADTPMTFEEAAKSQQETGSNDDIFNGTKYCHGGRIYHVGSCGDGKYRTFFCFAVDPTQEQPCCNIPKCDAPEIAQKMLDNYAAQHDFEIFTETTSEDEAPLTSEQSSDDLPADAAGEAESADAGQQEQAEEMNELAGRDDVPGPGNGEPDFTNNSDDFENDSAESDNKPCDWKNASGGDDDEDEPEPPENNIPAGELVSLMDDSFTNLINIFDSSINEALRVAVKARQGFTFQAKITFDYRGGAFAIKHDEGYQFDPIKVKTKGELGEEIQIVLDEDGNPIIPYDRQHQINFDELQPERNIPPSGTATVDGSTGIVEDYQEDGEEPEDPPTSDDITNEIVGTDLEKEKEPEQLLPTCDHEDCPFHGAADNGCTGCCFDTEDPDGMNYAGDVWTAVNMESCQRPEVLNAYRRNNPDDDYDGSDDPEEQDFSENNEEDYAS